MADKINVQNIKDINKLSRDDIENLKTVDIVPLPSYETKRLCILRETKLLYTDNNDPDYDRYTSLTSRVLNIQHCSVTLIETNNVWYKSKIGFKYDSDLRNQSLASFTILPENADVFVIEDTFKDHTYKSICLTRGPPYIRFYAGAALIVEGVKIGSLCICDYRPRPDFNLQSRMNLMDFGAAISALIRERRRSIMNIDILDSLRETINNNTTNSNNNNNAFISMNNSISNSANNSGNNSSSNSSSTNSTTTNSSSTSPTNNITNALNISFPLRSPQLENKKIDDLIIESTDMLSTSTTPHIFAELSDDMKALTRKKPSTNTLYKEYVENTLDENENVDTRNLFDNIGNGVRCNIFEILDQSKKTIAEMSDKCNINWMLDRISLDSGQHICYPDVLSYLLTSTVTYFASKWSKIYVFIGFKKNNNIRNHKRSLHSHHSLPGVMDGRLSVEIRIKSPVSSFKKYLKKLKEFHRVTELIKTESIKAMLNKDDKSQSQTKVHSNVQSMSTSSNTSTNNLANVVSNKQPNDTNQPESEKQKSSSEEEQTYDKVQTRRLFKSKFDVLDDILREIGGSSRVTDFYEVIDDSSSIFSSSVNMTGNVKSVGQMKIKIPEPISYNKDNRINKITSHHKNMNVNKYKSMSIPKERSIEKSASGSIESPLDLSSNENSSKEDQIFSYSNISVSTLVTSPRVTPIKKSLSAISLASKLSRNSSKSNDGLKGDTGSVHSHSSNHNSIRSSSHSSKSSTDNSSHPTNSSNGGSTDQSIIAERLYDYSIPCVIAIPTPEMLKLAAQTQQKISELSIESLKLPVKETSYAFKYPSRFRLYHDVKETKVVVIITCVGANSATVDSKISITKKKNSTGSKVEKAITKELDTYTKSAREILLGTQTLVNSTDDHDPNSNINKVINILSNELEDTKPFLNHDSKVQSIADRSINTSIHKSSNQNLDNYLRLSATHPDAESHHLSQSNLPEDSDDDDKFPSDAKVDYVDNLVKLLKSQGYDVTVTHKAEEGIELLKWTKFDVAFVDITMKTIGEMSVLQVYHTWLQDPIAINRINVNSNTLIIGVSGPNSYTTTSMTTSTMLGPHTTTTTSNPTVTTSSSTLTPLQTSSYSTNPSASASVVTNKIHKYKSGKSILKSSSLLVDNMLPSVNVELLQYNAFNCGMHYYFHNPADDLNLLIYVMSVRRKYKKIDEVINVLDAKLTAFQNNTHDFSNVTSINISSMTSDVEDNNDDDNEMDYI
mmetsp:Transcript_10884/g.9792  ORF Transcript_10884/g.9792 Transcript_10884/m.9792 type:complete len:1238 (+) Transcript_10884:56-3769(+)